MKVKCINNFEAEASLTEGKIYILQGVYNEKFVLIDDTGISHVWFSNRFEIVEQTKDFITKEIQNV